MQYGVQYLCTSSSGIHATMSTIEWGGKSLFEGNTHRIWGVLSLFDSNITLLSTASLTLTGNAFGETSHSLDVPFPAGMELQPSLLSIFGNENAESRGGMMTHRHSSMNIANNSLSGLFISHGVLFHEGDAHLSNNGGISSLQSRSNVITEVDCIRSTKSWLTIRGNMVCSLHSKTHPVIEIDAGEVRIEGPQALLHVKGCHTRSHCIFFLETEVTASSGGALVLEGNDCVGSCLNLFSSHVYVRARGIFRVIGNSAKKSAVSLQKRSKLTVLPQDLPFLDNKIQQRTSGGAMTLLGDSSAVLKGCRWKSKNYWICK